ncbi:tyrosine-type recombinase/integrase [Natronolimnohabitans sp. A-GB9]|uniref:tyrosine-type recombinase/integrase n=1 Tax=Natronolimnohabitans sp. A-GB9 TaxID=3069757 RepID=UPI0027B18827|nr:tyrosine-type recombinase/integrase [Natronolimnohabitans sp. A-GB9]MDQ2052918.1 tyrosine-type recombinase/integrase [Natronolimnohabitans sp. A-GB9]
MGDINDPQDFAGGLKRQHRLLEQSDDVHDSDRPQIERWLRKKDGSVAISTLKTYLRRVRAASERSDTPLVDMDEPDYHELVFDLRHEHDLADSTVQSYENAVLLFLSDMTDADWTDDVDRTKVERSGPDVDNMLTPKDIQALTTTARHQRDVAFIEFLADTGARLTMALSLRVRDVDLEEPPTYKPNGDAVGLKGAPITEYPLIDSAAAIRSYLRTAHPRPNEPDAALFHKIKPHSRGEDGERWIDDGAVVANAARQQLSRIANRADIDKPVKPHAFRHAAITRMVREGYSRSQIEHRVHWTLDTNMWETYEHITSEEHNEDIFREAGILDPDDGPDRIRKDCGNCQQPLAPHHDWCPNCGQPAAPGASDQHTEAKDTVLEALVDETNPATRRELRALLDELDERPDTARDVDHDDPS